MIDNLSTIAGFAGRPVGRTETLHVRTSDPSRDFTVGLSTDSVTLGGSEPVADPELDLPSEAFIRLVYGRLDPSTRRDGRRRGARHPAPDVPRLLTAPRGHRRVRRARPGPGSGDGARGWSWL